ncbi:MULTISPECIES: hypothetical protein [Roseobacteraceae]|jgi:uncharacterized protein YcfL|uniref:hypothetical protein n=1 Tax=Roseobacteraceae TaxID=2854170 RepID=UPI0012FD244B|nr:MULTISPECIES: hypothetical protein [Roseobacteraceae]
MTSKSFVKFTRPFTLFLALLSVAACESPQDTAARQAQFDGLPLSQVIATIGAPTQKSSTSAIWQYNETKTDFVPIYSYDQFGKARVSGQRQQTVTLSCTFQATLDNNRVVASSYDGNSCGRFAPKLST